MDKIATAIRISGTLGIRPALNYFGQMIGPLLVMLLPATLWNGLAFAIGWIISFLFK
jgi:hypothetical protein